MEDVMSGSYTLLRDTWIYQDIRQEVQQELQVRYTEEQRHILLAIVRVRFPRIEGLLQQLIEERNEPELLQALIILVGTARLEKDVRQGISRERAENAPT
jgi:hypothetical protein